jgi:hypothetical protein
LVIVPPIPETVITDGYGVPAPESGIVIAAVLVNALVPVGNELTVTTKFVLTVNSPSLTLTVIVAVPLCPAVGVTATVRLAPLPPTTMLLNGTKLRFDELVLTVRLPTAVSTSPTVKLKGPVEVFTLTV